MVNSLTNGEFYQVVHKRYDPIRKTTKIGFKEDCTSTLYELSGKGEYKGIVIGSMIQVFNSEGEDFNERLINSINKEEDLYKNMRSGAKRCLVKKDGCLRRFPSILKCYDFFNRYCKRDINLSYSTVTQKVKVLEKGVDGYRDITEVLFMKRQRVPKSVKVKLQSHKLL